MATYHWTEESAEIEVLAKQADAIEIAGCTDDGDITERVSDGVGADFWSVYFHFTPEWPADPNGLAAAKALAEKMEWHGLWIGGGKADGRGYTFVCLPGSYSREWLEKFINGAEGADCFFIKANKPAWSTK